MNYKEFIKKTFEKIKKEFQPLSEEEAKALIPKKRIPTEDVVKKLKLISERIQPIYDIYDKEERYGVDPTELKHVSIELKNKQVVNALLIDILLINYQLTLIKKGKNISPISKIKLNLYKRLFKTDKYYKQSYLRGDFNLPTINIYRASKVLISSAVNLIVLCWQKLYNCACFIRYDVIGRWNVYLIRFIIISVIFFVPFIQLADILFFNQPNPLVVDPLTGYFSYACPALARFVKRFSATLTQENNSLLILVPYFYFFIQRSKQWKIPRGIAYQGAFALLSMLFRYSLDVGEEAAFYIFKTIKRLFFLEQYQNMELLRDDVSFYIEDLEEMRFYKEQVGHLVRDVFSVEDLALLTNIYDSTSMLALIAVIALLYNCVYFICRGKKPIIPVVTKTVERMITDRPKELG